MGCIDRFLANEQVSKTKLQLVGITSLFIAAKYEEIWAPEIRELIYITDKTYDRNQILAMEIEILKVLEYRISAPTCNTFLKHFLKVFNASKQTSILSQYLLELSLVD